MNKTLIRSYRVDAEGDLLVHALQKGTVSDLSKHYEDVPRDRHELEPDAFLDVFRYDNGELGWVASPNGHTPASAASMKLLLDAFVRDVNLQEGLPRAF